jgi:hypothetical protein
MLNCVKYNNNNYQLDLFNDKIKFLKDYLKDDYNKYEDIINNYRIIETSKLKINLEDFINHSGGAYGGDTYWDLIGREFGVTNHKHYKDAGNANLSQQLRNKGVKAEVLTEQQMNFARQKVKELLGIDYSIKPTDTEKQILQKNLQVRNFYQVYNADAVYAIAKINNDNKSVSGGTNTAIQLGIKLNKPVYVWDINSETWNKFELNLEDPLTGKTVSEFYEVETPTLTKNFAGIGSRDIENYNVQKDGKWQPREEYVGKAKEEKAKQAIRGVYQKTLNQPTEIKPKIDSSKKISAKGKMTFSYGGNKRSGVTSTTTFEAIKNGERTATTRYESDGHIDYWKNLKEGDIIEWESANGEKVLVEVTKPLHKLVGSGKTAEQWSKLEGWSVDYFNSKVKPKLDGAWQIEYKTLTQEQPIVEENNQEITKEDTDKLPPCIG